MEIDFKEALEKIRENEDIKKSIEKDYFLNSGIAIFKPQSGGLDRWIITFYSSKKEEVVQGIVKGEGGIEFGESAKAIDPSTEELNPDDIELTAEEALEKTNKERENLEEGERKISQIIMSIKKEEKRIIWEVNLISASLSLFQAKIDAKTGEVFQSSRESLLKTEEDIPFAQ
ncbi:MAG: hypothetical protein ACOCTT_00170 [archaeon]